MTTKVTFRAFAGVLIPMLLGLSLIRTRATSAGLENMSFSDESPNIDSLAARVAEKLVKTGNKLVAVGQFHGEKPTDTRAYGLKLSEQLSVALASSNAGIQVFDNARLIYALEEKKWMAIDLEDSLVFRSIASAEGVRVAIDGRFKTSGHSIEVSLTLTNTADDQKIAEIKTKLPATEATGSLPDTPVRDPVTQVYLPGVGGVAPPQCKSPSFHLKRAQREFQALNQCSV